jgi:hypothetical protein
MVLRTARAVLEADPSRAEQAVADTHEDRRVWHSTDTGHAHGIFGISGPVQSTAAGNAAFDELARKWQADGVPGSLHQLRFDAATHSSPAPTQPAPPSPAAVAGWSVRSPSRCSA